MKGPSESREQDSHVFLEKAGSSTAASHVAQPGETTTEVSTAVGDIDPPLSRFASIGGAAKTAEEGK